MKDLFLLLLPNLIFITGILNGQVNANDERFENASIERATSLLTSAEEKYQARQYNLSLSLAEEAEKGFSTHQDWIMSTKCLILQSKIMEQTGDANERLKISDRAVNYATTYLSTQDSLLGLALRQKGEALMVLEKIDEANNYLGQAIPILIFNDLPESAAWCNVLRSSNYLNSYKLDSAEFELLAVERLLEDEIPEEDQTDLVSTILYLYGYIYNLQGDLKRSIEITDRALSMELAKPELSAADSVYVASYFENLGAFYLVKGDNSRSLDNFRRSFDYNSDTENDPNVLFNIGVLYNKQGDYQESLEVLKKALAKCKGFSDELWLRTDILNQLGLAYRKLGDYRLALSYCREALDLPTDYRRYITLSNIGNTYVELGRSEKAIHYLNEAISTHENDSIAKIENRFFIARVFRQMGDAHLLANDPESALAYYQRALVENLADFNPGNDLVVNPLLENAYEPSYLLNALHGKARALARFEDHAYVDASLETFELAMAWMDTIYASHASEAAQLDWSSQFKTIYEDAITVVFNQYRTTGNTDYLNQAFAFAEKTKNVILLEHLRGEEGKSYAGIPAELIQKEKDLQIDVAYYQQEISKAETGKKEKKKKLNERYLAQTRLELADLRERLESDYPDYRELRYGGQIPSIAEVQSKIVTKDKGVVIYFVGQKNAYAFVITKSSADLISLPAPVEIKSATEAYQHELLNVDGFLSDTRNAFLAYNRKSFDLYGKVLEPVLAKVEMGVSELLIIPDGVLTTIPFSALTTDLVEQGDIDFAKLPYLLNNYQVHYAYSATLQLKNQDRRGQLSSQVECLALAPLYEGGEIAQRGPLTQLRDLGRLEGTAREIQEIANYVQGEFDFGVTATEQQFKTLAPQYGLLHLAMHGIVDRENPNFNHLKFSEVEEEADDNRLYHHEIANLDLSAQLVVLSACETGVGKYEEGEGVYSLARSFSYAGVPSIVMSLWRVNDRSTSELMPVFYHYLANERTTKDKALHQAKLDFLQNADLEFRHPFYWAAFVGIGDTQSIYGSSGSWMLWGALIASLLMLFAWFWRR